MSDDAKPPLGAAVGSVDWRSIADDLASALRRLDALYLSEQDAAAPTNRPEWLRRPLQRYHCALGDTPNPPLAEAAGSARNHLRLPCPFCGRSPRLTGVGYSDGGRWVPWFSVGCDASVRGCGAHQSAHTEEAAWELWNTRYESPNVPAPVPGTVEYDEETQLMQEAASALRFYTHNKPNAAVSDGGTPFAPRAGSEGTQR